MDIVKFWNRLPLGTPPFVHPDDRPILERNGRSFSDTELNFDNFVKSDRCGAFQDHRFHLSLLPVPYVGNLVKADIFLLLLNSGFDFVDYFGEWRMTNFRKSLEKNLRQDFRRTNFPFLYLNPEFCWHGGFTWWERKFRDVPTRIAKERFHGRYFDALRDLAHRAAALDPIPYHSISFRQHRMLRLLPSSQHAQNFARNTLASRANKGNAAIIITRQHKEWGMESPASRTIVTYTGGRTRSASLGHTTPGGKAILAQYGIH